MANYSNTQQFLDTAGLRLFYSLLKQKLASASADFPVDATTVNGHTISIDVPENAKFTDTDTKDTAGNNQATDTIYIVGTKTVDETAEDSTEQTYANKNVSIAADGTITTVKDIHADKIYGDGTYITNIDASTIDGHTVATDVPANAVFTDTDTHYISYVSNTDSATAQAPATNGNVYLLHGDKTSAPVSNIKVVGSNEISVTSTNRNIITISANLGDYAKKSDIDATIASAMSFKGTKADITALKAIEAANVKTGDIYAVIDDGKDDTGEKNVCYVCTISQADAIENAEDSDDKTVIYGKDSNVKWERLGPTFDIEPIAEDDIRGIFEAPADNSGTQE